MSEYRRIYQTGSKYFFTVVTHNRKPILTQHIELLKKSFIKTQQNYSFKIDAIVILPDHLHCIWDMPTNDADFSTRWRLIKYYFSKNLPSITNTRNEKLIWQRRYWEHLIRAEYDWKQHLDYIHFNPVKHGYVNSPKDWPYSSFMRFVKNGFYDENWGNFEPTLISSMDFE